LEDILQTIKFLEKSGLSSAAIFVAVPYPGTELFNICKEKGYIADNITWSDFLVEGKDVNPIVRNKHFTLEQLRHIRNYIDINVVKRLNRSQKLRKLDHRKKIESILSGKLDRAKESRFAKIMDYGRKGIKRPGKIVPFVLKKLTNGIENIQQ